MGNLKITLTRSLNARPEDQLATARGLGLKKFGDVRVLRDTPPIRGMIAKLQHMLVLEETGDALSSSARARGKSQAKAAK